MPHPDIAPLRRLQTALRTPLPDGFTWNMCDPASCALGLAVAIGIAPAPSHISKVLGLSRNEHAWLFFPHPKYHLGNRPFSDITPEIQADRIDQLLARRT